MTRRYKNLEKRRRERKKIRMMNVGRVKKRERKALKNKRFDVLSWSDRDRKSITHGENEFYRISIVVTFFFFF